MISPHKNSPGAGSPRSAAPLRGLFMDGVWRCNCPGRPPAVKFQTKNHGINHGRWCKVLTSSRENTQTNRTVYTCQQPQYKRCDFFLWSSDAEAREKLVVLANSRSELDTFSKTPTKRARHENGLPTPVTDRKPDSPAAWKFQTQTPSKSANAKARMMAEDSGDTDSYDWDDSLDDDLELFMDRPRQPDFGQDLPRKAPRTPTRTSPRKRKILGFGFKGGDSTSHDSGVLTPQHSQTTDRIPPSAEVSMTPTPSRYTNALSADSGSEISAFAGQALKLLEGHNVMLPRKAQNELVSFLNTHDLKTKGIIRGRDISRIALRKKDEQIMRLNNRVQSLESQKELDRAMINGLRNNAGRS
ncbi:hypothetical protein PHISCL_09238 [Aspergillus sclerotialis]|uniref:GRF-type domain-containing protein n=1 Tax=Aspergillus sclerotialis TaxID=2070753 RepID=A0A3A2Z5S0_9EURO|nr:hypothetical protein PHISCL_09238 [Aspergillus sclerotialis]